MSAREGAAAATGAKKERLHTLDTLRGICIILMVVYHGFFDIWVFGLFPGSFVGELTEAAYSSAVLSALQNFFSGLFILISGISCHLSRSNLKRGARLFAVAMGVTAATALSGTGVVIIFGILHFLSISMLIFGLCDRFLPRLLAKVPALVWPALFIGALALTKAVNPIEPVAVSAFGVRLGLPLFIFGFYSKGFFSADYFPLMPWLFLFFFGASLGRRLPKASDAPAIWRVRLPVVTAAGRHTLWIYLIHQPVILALLWLAERAL